MKNYQMPKPEKQKAVWDLEERYDFTDLCKEKINFEEPVIYWIERCYELEDGKIN